MVNSTEVLNEFLHHLQHSHSHQHHHHAEDHDVHVARHDDGEEEEDTGSVLIAKVTAMVVLFCASTLCGSIPFILNRWFHWTDENSKSPRSAMVVKCLLYFGGGVLLCTTFLHLLPEVKENIEELQNDGTLPELRFHLAEFLTCMGKVEKQFHEEGEESESVPPTSQQDLIGNDLENQKYQMQHQEHNHEHNHHSDMQTHDCSAEGHHSHLPTDLDLGSDMIVSSLRGLLVVLALSIHELFEGLAVGLEPSSSKVWLMFGSVSAHKLVLAFCVGVELIVTKTRTWLAMVYVLTFAIVSPLGIGIGILISNHDNSSATAIPSAILQGLATGTLLYVVFFEILSKDKSGLVAYIAFLVGFFVMFGIQLSSKTGILIY
uniref:Zinc/iron permease n=1 Tax=Megaselia scalaris TaxID=36166 RepID=T1GAW1_MEGSC